MGFDVCSLSKVVTVDHSHNNFATTSVHGNPKIKRYDGLVVIGLFRRNKGATKSLRLSNPKAKIFGDNSPMLYALKNMDGLTTRPQDVRSLFRNARQIIKNELPTHHLVFDHIISIPSSHKLALVISRITLQVCRKLGHPVSHLKSVLRKSSGNDVKSQIAELKIASKDRSGMSNNAKKFIKDHGPNADFQIKYIQRTNLRKHIELLQLEKFESVDNREVKILLVDDMITTGSSLVAARDLVLQRFPRATIYGVCLFSAS